MMGGVILTESNVQGYTSWRNCSLKELRPEYFAPILIVAIISQLELRLVEG